MNPKLSSSVWLCCDRKKRNDSIKGSTLEAESQNFLDPVLAKPES